MFLTTAEHGSVQFASVIVFRHRSGNIGNRPFTKYRKEAVTRWHEQ